MSGIINGTISPRGMLSQSMESMLSGGESPEYAALSLYGERYCPVYEQITHCGKCNIYPCPADGGPALARRANSAVAGGPTFIQRVEP